MVLNGFSYTVLDQTFSTIKGLETEVENILIYLRRS